MTTNSKSAKEIISIYGKPIRTFKPVAREICKIIKPEQGWIDDQVWEIAIVLKRVYDEGCESQVKTSEYDGIELRDVEWLNAEHMGKLNDGDTSLGGFLKRFLGLG